MDLIEASANGGGSLASHAPWIIGVRVDTVQMADARAILDRFADERASAVVHLCNAWTSVLASRDPAYADILNAGSLNLPDGMSLVKACRLLGHREIRDRVYGPDLMLEMIDRGRELGHRHFLYGGADGTAHRLAARMEERFPDARIVGVVEPPFRLPTPAEEGELAHEIERSEADFVWVGLGTPKQDEFMERFRSRVKVGALIGVGAAFDFLSGRKPQAPRWMQGAGLEWAHRLASEPRRLWRRYLIGNTSFVLRFGAQLLSEPGGRPGGRAR